VKRLRPNEEDNSRKEYFEVHCVSACQQAEVQYKFIS